MNTLDPDAELLSRIARGDQSAIREIMTRKLSRLIALGVADITKNNKLI